MRRLGFVLLLASLVTAAPPYDLVAKEPTSLSPSSGSSSLTPETLKQMSATIRGFTLGILPDPLYVKDTGWGGTDRAPSRIRWEGKGLESRPRMVYVQKNHGLWKKVRVTGEDPARNLVLEIKNVEPAGDDRTHFDVEVALRAGVHFHLQNWQRGLKVWDATADARMRLKLRLRCEATARIESKGRLIPELVYRLRVIRAEVDYDEFELRHIAGVGGELAKFLGDVARKSVREFRPSFEERLLAKAEARILRVGDTKEIRLGGAADGKSLK